MKRIILKIFSDYVCPFCYTLIPKIERLKKELPINVEWYPVLSHPEIPDQGLPLNELIKDKERLEDAVKSATTLAKQEGIDLIIPRKVSCSKMAIWMAECARQNGMFEEYHKKVYEAYFRQGKDIGDDQTIPEIIKSLNIPKDNILSYCRDRKGYAKAISRRMMDCKNHDVSQVPTMILGDLKIEGSWPYPLLLSTLESTLNAD
jgi:predicted DsbA family dithiol-disulfide isomerase